MLDQRLHALTAQITKMTPQQRQQFAILHKNDPILVGLTKHINDQDNALRASLKAQQNPQALAPKPTIVDETIAGLATLPAPTLEEMPDGGVAGDDSSPAPVQRYADGGEVEEARNPLAFMNPGDIWNSVQRWRDSGKPLLPYLGISSERKPTQAELMRGYVPRRSPNGPPVVHQGASTKPAGIAAVAPQAETAPDVERIVRGGAGPMGGGGGGGMRSPAMPAAPTGGGGIDMLGDYNKHMASLPRDPFSKERTALTDSITASAKEELDDVKKDQSEMGLAGLEREKRLKAREGKLNEKESKNAGMAIFEAGLAMMAGKSRHAMVNIGEGALVGTKRFREGQKEIDEGREKLDDAFSALDDLRRNEKRMDKKELREAQAKVRAAVNSGLELTLKGIQDQYGVNAKTANTMLQGGIAMAMNEKDNATRQYTAQLGYKGGIDQANISAGATMGAARMRQNSEIAGLKQRQFEWRQSMDTSRMGLSAMKFVEDSVNAKREAVAKAFGDWTPAMETQARNEAWTQIKSMPGMQQIGPTGTPAATAPAAGLDPSQWSVREKR